MSGGKFGLRSELLDSEQIEAFRINAKGFIFFRLFSDWRDPRPARFNVGWARRWVCKRAHDLGWTQERFFKFERGSIGYSRNEHHIERIGKKYQWIALRELIARMADNLAYFGGYEEQDGSPPAYRGAREIYLRDIDPSLLLTETHYEAWTDWEKVWWVPFGPPLHSISLNERRGWLLSDNDIINSSALIEVRDPKSKRQWLVLSGFSAWRGKGLIAGRIEQQRETWFRLACFVVRKADEFALTEGLKEKILTDPHNLPTIELNSEFYLGEYPWHPELENIDEWSSPEDHWRSMPVPVRPTVATYSCSRGGYDYSIDKTINLEIPAPWLARSMNLRMKNGRSPNYTDDSGNTIFFDPSIKEAGPTAALIDESAFKRFLQREELSAVWIVAGEKNVYSGGMGTDLHFGGRLLHTAIYFYGTNGLERHFLSELVQPSDDQLAKFNGDDVSNSVSNHSKAPDTQPKQAREPGSNGPKRPARRGSENK